MAHLTINLLGPPRFLLDGIPLQLDQRKPEALLAYLAATQHPHSRDALAALLWPENVRARDRLRHNLWLLRKALGAWADDWLLVEREQIGLHAGAPVTVDAVEFCRQADAGKQHVADWPGVLTQASVRYRGDFLAGFTLPDAPDFDAWQYQQRLALRQDFISLLATGIHALDECGEHEQAIRFTRRWLEVEPSEERAHARLMQLYLATGQRTAALRQYEACEQILREELDVAPSAATEALHEAAKAKRNAAVIKAVSSDVPTQSHNLPHKLTPLLGRADECEAVAKMLSNPDVRLVTLTGPGGVGKTRLAIQVAFDVLQEFAEDVHLVSLAPVRDFKLVASTIARVLEIALHAGRPVLEQLTTALSSRRLLLVVDNCEHVLEAAPQLMTLLETCPHLKLLLTSREALRSPGEHELVLSPLALPAQGLTLSPQIAGQNAAVQIFCERAQKVRRGFTLDHENASTLVEICRQLDGLPLGLELAAAQTKFFSPAALLDQMERSAEVPSLGSRVGGGREQPARHQTLHQAVAWSYRLLSPTEQRLFQRVSIFVGGFTLEAATAICGNPTHPQAFQPEQVLQAAIDFREKTRYNDQSGKPTASFLSTAVSDDVLEGITSLVNKSLIQSQIQPDGSTRFSLLETIREYGLSRLVQSEAQSVTRRRHAVYYFALAVAAAAYQRTARQFEWSQHLNVEQYNLRAVHDWATEQNEADMAMRLTNALFEYRIKEGHQHEGAARAEEILPLTEQLPPSAVLARFYFSAGMLFGFRGERRRGNLLYERCLQVGRAVNDRFNVAYALALLADRAHDEGDYKTADQYNEESLVLYQELGDQWGYAVKLSHVGCKIGERGDLVKGAAVCTQALDILRSIGEKWGTCLALTNCGRVALLKQTFPEAAHYLRESLAIARQLGDGYMEALSQYLLARALLNCGEPTQVLDLLRASLHTFTRFNSPIHVADVLEALAEAALAQGQAEHALRLCAAAAHYWRMDELVLAPLQQAHFDATVAAVSSVLDADHRKTIWQSGQHVPLDEAYTLVF